jgi:glycosyltransferase involved in cell wall biosynthesis
MAHHAEHIFTNSNFSKSEIVKWYGAPVDRTSVTYLGSDHFSTLPSDPAVLNRFGISGRYVLAVSSHNPNKNFQRVQDALTALAETGVQLVIAGAPDSRIYRNGLKPSDKVHAVGYVGDPELKALYEHAACFVFASLYEGFGLPPLEALASGCPIVVSRAGSLPELFDGIGTFCDPYSATDIAAAIQRTIQSPSSRDDLKDFANKFTWENCARQTLEVLNRLS